MHKQICANPPSLPFQIIESMVEVQLKAGEFLMRQGDDGEDMYVLQSGLMAVAVLYAPSRASSSHSAWRPADGVMLAEDPAGALSHPSFKAAARRVPADAVEVLLAARLANVSVVWPTGATLHADALSVWLHLGGQPGIRYMYVDESTYLE